MSITNGCLLGRKEGRIKDSLLPPGIPETGWWYHTSEKSLIPLSNLVLDVITSGSNPFLFNGRTFFSLHVFYVHKKKRCFL